MKTKGMTLTEVMITVSIIGLLAVMAIPAVTGFREEAQEAVCFENLNAIDGAKVQWAVTEGEDDSAEATEEELAEYMVGNFPAPVVAGALYKIGEVLAPALCSFHGNRFMDGLGVTVPSGLIKLIETGQLDAGDVIEGDWNWSGYDVEGNDSSMLYTDDIYRSRYNSVYRAEHYYSTCTSTDESIDQHRIPSELPEITVNGNTLRGDMIRQYSQQLSELNSEYYEKKAEFWDKLSLPFPHNGAGTSPSGDEYYVSKMEKGGYEVVNYDDENHLYKRNDYYDHKGNLIGSRVRTYNDPYYYNGVWWCKSLRDDYYDGEGNLIA